MCFENPGVLVFLSSLALKIKGKKKKIIIKIFEVGFVMKLEMHRCRIVKLLVSFSQNKATVNTAVLEIHPWQNMMPHSKSFSYQLFAGNNTTQFRLNLHGLPGSWGECFLQSALYWAWAPASQKKKKTDASFPLLTSATCATPIWHTRRMAQTLPFIFLGN